MNQTDTSQIVRCLKCGTQNRVTFHPGTIRPMCGHCGTRLPDPTVISARHSHKPRTSIPVLNGVILVLILLAGTVAFTTPSLLTHDFSALREEETALTDEFTAKCAADQTDLQRQLEEQLKQVDAIALKRNATEHYATIIQSRESFTKRYALTPREKAQLRMRMMGSDSAKDFRGALLAVAREASPHGSDVRVDAQSQGIALHIDFDMSSMTAGEHGTRTKHHTKASLKKEVDTLISRVTSDVFQFCKHLDLSTIYVGCRHVVRSEDMYGNFSDKNMTLYKIRIAKDAIPELRSNPFLDEYSTAQHMAVEEDNFGDIEIVTTTL